MQFTLNLDKEQLAAIDAAAAKTGMSREDAVRRAIYHMAILDKAGPKLYAELAPGLADSEARRYATDEEVAGVFAKYGIR